MEHILTKNDHHYGALDSLRGVCACMVVLTHFQSAGFISNAAVVQHAFLFVDFFFVLSGFVIAASYGDRLANGFSILKFMGLRLGRIYPLHLAILLLFLAFELTYASGAIGHVDRPPFHAPNDPASFIASLTLVQDFLPYGAEGWNLPSWSIQVEIWTYLLFAIVFRYANRHVVVISLGLAVVCAAYLFYGRSAYLQNSAFGRCIYGFSLGVIAFRIQSHIGHESFGSRAITSFVEICAIFGVVITVSLVGVDPRSMAMPVVFFVVILIFAQQRGMVSAILQKRGPRLLGTLSYSIYMTHEFLNYRLRNVLNFIQNHTHHRLFFEMRGSGGGEITGSALMGDAMSLAFLAMVVICSYCTYQMIERPAQRWSRRQILGNRPSPSAVTSEREAPTF